MDCSKFDTLLARGQSEALSVTELRFLVGFAQSGLGRRGSSLRETLPILRRQAEREVRDATTINERAKRENRSLLASEQRKFDAHLEASKQAGELLAEASAADFASTRMPESMRGHVGLAGGEIRDGGFNFLPNFDEYRDASSMGSSQGTFGGYLVPVEQSTQLFDRLRPMCVVLQAGPKILDMVGETLNVPRLGGSATCSIVPEGALIPSAGPALAAVVFRARKLACLVRGANSWFADSNPSARSVLSMDLVLTMAAALDRECLEGNSGPGNMSGLRFCGANAVALGIGNGAVPTLDAIAAAIGRLESSNARASAIFMHPRTWATFSQAKTGEGVFHLSPNVNVGAEKKLFGVPVFTSSQVSITETTGNRSDCSWIGVADMSQIALARRQDTILVYDSSRYLEYDETAIRCTSRFDFGALNVAGVEIVTGVLPA